MARNVIKITSGGKKLEKSANLIEDAKSEVSVARDKLNGCKGASSTMGGILATAYINAGVNVLLKTIQKEMDLLDDTRSVILDDKKALVSVDKIKNKVKADLNNRDLKSLKKSYSSLVGAIGVKKAKNLISKLKLGDKVVFSKNAKSILRLKKNKNSKSGNGSGSNTTSNTTSTSKTGTKVLHGDVVDANLAAIANLKQRLKKALKNGNKKKAYNIYKSLVGLVGVNQAKKYLSNLGYKVGKNSNGEKIIKQIKDEKMNDKSSNNNGDKKKEIPEDPQKIGNDDDKKDDKPENPDDSGNDDPGDSGTGDDGNEEPTTPEENPSNNDNSGGESNPSSESVATPSEDNNSNNSNNYSSGGNDNVSNVSTNNDNYSDSGSSSDDSSGDGLVFDDASSDDSGSNVDESTLVPSDDSSIDDVVSTPTKKVKTLEDDTTTSTSSSKSGLGVAVPLGLGVVATGAAAVAGARYIKNKKESTYDDNYDDENNDLGDDNSDYSYSDTSSNYDSDSYMSDDYLGPAGSSYTDTNLDENSNNSDSVSDSYIDSEEYEDDSNDDDLVLRDLN